MSTIESARYENRMSGAVRGRRLVTVSYSINKSLYTKQQIFDDSWDEPYMEDDSTVMVHISNPRNKIEDEPKNRS